MLSNLSLLSNLLSNFLFWGNFSYILLHCFSTDAWSTNSFSTEIGSASNQIFITDLKALTSYSLRVFAVNSMGESEASSILNVKTEEEGKDSETTIRDDNSRRRWECPEILPFLWESEVVLKFQGLPLDSSSSWKRISCRMPWLSKTMLFLPCLSCFLLNTTAPSTAPLSVRVEPLSSKSVRVKWKVMSFGK